MLILSCGDVGIATKMGYMMFQSFCVRKIPVQDDQAQGNSAPARAAEPPPQAEPGGGGVTGRLRARIGGGATFQAGAAA